MKIAIVGTGGVGGYFGGLLARDGHDVTFIARGEHLHAMQTDGLSVESIHGDFKVEHVNATDNPGEFGPVDFALFTVKTWDIEKAGEQIRPLVGSNTAILPLQNGVDVSERLIEVLGPESVLGGTVQVVSFIAQPGLIRQRSPFRKIVLGELNGAITPRVEAIGKALADAGADVEISSDINKARWTKFVFIASFSGMGAVTRVPAGPLMACPEAVSMLEQAMREIAALAEAHHVILDSDVVEKTMAFCRALPAETTASMQRDILEGRPSELEAQNGFIAKRGAQMGVAVPVNTFIYSALLPQEQKARNAGQ